jgi:hypothetical protein
LYRENTAAFYRKYPDNPDDDDDEQEQVAAHQGKFGYAEYKST